MDFSGFEFDRGFIAGLPESPGIYIMRDANGVAIYVGKASNLRARVQSYFRPRIERDEKTERILEALSRVEIEETGSELAALLAEQRAIRALQPAINIQFDVHDRPEASKGPARRILLILPAPDAAEVEIFLLDGNRAMRRVKLPREEALARLRPLLAEFFFGPKKPAGAAGGRIGARGIADRAELARPQRRPGQRAGRGPGRRPRRHAGAAGPIPPRTARFRESVPRVTAGRETP